MLDKNLAGPDTLKLMHSPGSDLYLQMRSLEQASLSKGRLGQGAHQELLFFNSEAILTIEANITLIYNAFHISDLVT